MLASVNAQPRPMSSTASSCTLARPHSVNFERVHWLAFAIDGELVRRGPITSVRWFRVAITCERWKASWRICEVTSRSTFSCACALPSAATSKAAVNINRFIVIPGELRQRPESSQHPPPGTRAFGHARRLQP